MNEPQEPINPNNLASNDSNQLNNQDSVSPVQSQPAEEVATQASPGQISPSFDTRSTKSEEPPPQVVKKGKFIEGYNFKFLIVIILVVNGVFGILYFKNNSFSDLVKAAADSIKSGIFKTSISEITGNKNESSTQAVTSATSSQNNTTTNYQSTEYDSFDSPAAGGSTATNPGYVTTQTPSENFTNTATSCIGEGGLVVDTSTNTTLGTCCNGLTPKNQTSTNSDGTELDKIGSGFYCQP